MTASLENTLTNWGRWGPEDERGTHNLLTLEIIKRATSLVKTGKVYSLGCKRRQLRGLTRFLK